MIKIRKPDATKTDKMKVYWVVKVGGLSLGLLVFGIERLFSIPEHSNLSYVLVAAAMGIFDVLFIALLLKQPRWILTREAQQNLREQEQQSAGNPLSQGNPFEASSN